METHAEEASKAVASAEKKLQNALEPKEQTELNYENLTEQLEKLRIRCGNLALLQLLLDRDATKTEARLWDAHVKVNGKFKVFLRGFRDGDVTKRHKHVEKRKAEKLYVDFIKASQRFYRAYIGRLPANFTGIDRVAEVAAKLGNSDLTAEIRKEATETQRHILEKSCLQTIIHLGDLSRWRETELQLKERNWGPAKGYYNLALSLDPAEGTGYNQLAVIAFSDEDHLGAVYYLYRAAVAGRPFPTAPDNLKVEMEKLLKIRVEESYGLMDKSEDDILDALEKRFLAFHAHCFCRPYDFVSFQQSANDILRMITLCFQDTKRGGLDHFLNRAVLISMAAENMAQKGMTKPVYQKKLAEDKLAREIERSCQAYFLLQRFNLMAFQSLLKVLARELPDEPENTSIPLSATARRVLPHLRQYSSWLLSHMRELVDTKYKSSRRLLEQVMGTYVQTLNLLRVNVDLFASSQIDHLLEEDERTISFTPFSQAVFRRRYLGSGEQIKIVRHNDGHGKEIEEELAETHLRATDLVVDALRLIKQKEELGVTAVPIDLEDALFVARAVPDPAPIVIESVVEVVAPVKTWRSKTQANRVSLNGTTTPNLEASTVELLIPPAAQSANVSDVEMSDRSGSHKRMASNGIHRSPAGNPAKGIQRLKQDSDEVQASSNTINSSSLLMGTPAPPVPVVSNTQTAMDLVRKMQRSSVSTEGSKRSPESVAKFVQPLFPNAHTDVLLPVPDGQARVSAVLSRQTPNVVRAEPSSSAIFEEELLQRQQEVQQRPLPAQGFGVVPTSWNASGETNYGQTPTGLDSIFRAYQAAQAAQAAQRAPSPSPYAGQRQVNGRHESRSASSHPPAGLRPIGSSLPLFRGVNGSG